MTDSGAEETSSLVRAARIMDQLRSPGGCPWDAEQTHSSLAPYLIEEAYETLEAIETADLAALREELGDLLLQVLFHARLAEEAPEGQRFSVEDVAADLVAKLTRRHPHVFADVTVNNADEVNENWDAIKKAEKQRKSVTDGVPMGQPALALAAKLVSRSRKAGIAVEPFSDSEPLTDAAQNRSASELGIGQKLLAVVDQAVQAGVDPEQALRDTARRYRDAIRAAEGVEGARGAEGAEGAPVAEGAQRRSAVTVVREDPPFDGDEKTTLVAFLDFHRATLRQKCDGLTPAQLIEQACPPSTLRLLGLVRHLTEVESAWFSQVLNGDPEYDVYATDADRDADLNIAVADEASVAATWARYDEEVARSRAVTNSHQLGDLAARTTRRGEQPTLRWVLVHLIEEYARHNGHADLLREAIDGSTGE